MELGVDLPPTAQRHVQVLRACFVVHHQRLQLVLARYSPGANSGGVVRPRQPEVLVLVAVLGGELGGSLPGLAVRARPQSDKERPPILVDPCLWEEGCHG